MPSDNGLERAREKQLNNYLDAQDKAEEKEDYFCRMVSEELYSDFEELEERFRKIAEDHNMDDCETFLDHIRKNW